jgi:hypothetical protein
MALLQPARPAARLQALAAVLMLSMVALVCGTLDVLTRIAPLMAWLNHQNEESCRQTRNLLYHVDHFESVQEQVLYEDLPTMDFSRGGVCFFGASEVQFSTKLWELPPETQALVHNFGMPACSQESELVWLRYLVEQKGMLKAGGGKTLVVLGTSYHQAFHPTRTMPAAFVDSLEGHGLFACDAQQGIHPLQVNPVAKFIDFEQTRQARCMVMIRDVFLHQLARWRHHGAELPRPQDPALYQDWRRTELGPQWKEKIDATAQVFRETIDYLRARHVQIRVVLMPLGSWEDALPYAAEYQQHITAICAEQQIPVLDWSKLLADDDFADSVHSDVFGMEKVQATYLDVALPFLRSTHALPATQ